MPSQTINPNAATPLIRSWQGMRGSFGHLINPEFFSMQVVGMDRAFQLLSNIGLAANGLTEEEANQLGAKIKQIASEDLNSRPYHKEAYTRDSGYKHIPLARTIDYKVKGGELEITAGDPKGGAPHAAFLEYGTSRHPPYPFMAPAIQEAMAEMKNNIGRRMKKGIIPAGGMMAGTQISRMVGEEAGLSGLLAMSSLLMSGSAGLLGMIV
jgi:HK97 gp10 family phage protein